jgi:hypothetical protein
MAVFSNTEIMIIGKQITIMSLNDLAVAIMPPYIMIKVITKTLTEKCVILLLLRSRKKINDKNETMAPAPIDIKVNMAVKLSFYAFLKQI